MTARWTYDRWAVRMPGGSLLSDDQGPIYYATRAWARMWARSQGGAPIRVTVTVTEIRG